MLALTFNWEFISVCVGLSIILVQTVFDYKIVQCIWFTRLKLLSSTTSFFFSWSIVHIWSISLMYLCICWIFSGFIFMVSLSNSLYLYLFWNISFFRSSFFGWSWEHLLWNMNFKDLLKKYQPHSVSYKYQLFWLDLL